MSSVNINQNEIDKWIEKFINWHYYPDYVLDSTLQSNEDLRLVDCPLIYQIPDDNCIYMFYTGFDGKGYRTFLAKSLNYISWQPLGEVMGFGPEGVFDHGGVSFGGLLFDSYDVNAPRFLKKHKEKYWALYGCYPRQGGYELRPGAEGLAWSEDGISWTRASDKAILTIEQAEQWEKSCIYQPWLVENDGLYFNFYNAAEEEYEQLGLATSKDLFNWKRYSGNPIIKNREGGYDEIFASDGKVFWDEDHWVMIYFGVDADRFAHIMVAFSKDLFNWIAAPEPLHRAGDHPGRLDQRYAHKVSLVYDANKDTYFMYYCAVSDNKRAIGLLISKEVI